MSQQTPGFEQQQRQLRPLPKREVTIPYMANMAEEFLVGLTWTLFGVVESNELAVRGRAGRVDVFGHVPSLLFYPLIANRLFGINAADRVAAERLSGTTSTQYEINFREASKNAD
ncbi:hypothetical protein NCG89_03005 [Spongiibacter taiwanensis]|uniref:hypothetical protein n=1 Tax=Spongiibacter taiwanensis TaxID=1748242 RepID=UPI0020351635|nr:hypothetical protein [Spongiibacter taiwanensis]USA43764.1 hypothetical protein NCG89_03005 [Spongiibacter taiwanensis]